MEDSARVEEFLPANSPDQLFRTGADLQAEIKGWHHSIEVGQFVHSGRVLPWDRSPCAVGENVTVWVPAVFYLWGSRLHL